MYNRQKDYDQLVNHSYINPNSIVKKFKLQLIYDEKNIILPISFLLKCLNLNF